jgi:hypothetical protein
MSLLCRQFWVTRLPFLWPLRGCNGHLTIRVSGVDNMKLDNGQPGGLGCASTVAEEDGGVVSRHLPILTLRVWGSTVRRIDRDGKTNEKSSVYNTLHL